MGPQPVQAPLAPHADSEGVGEAGEDGQQGAGAHGQQLDGDRLLRELLHAPGEDAPSSEEEDEEDVGETDEPEFCRTAGGILSLHGASRGEEGQRQLRPPHSDSVHGEMA